MSIYTGLWVVSNVQEDTLPKVACELLGKVKTLGEEHGEKVVAVLLGVGIKKAIFTAYQYGAEEVVFVDDSKLKQYDANSYALVLEKLIEKYKPSSLIFGADSFGRDLAPRIGVKLETGISADCIDIDIQEVDGTKLLVQKKPYLNGGAVADILCKEKRPQIATVKPGIIPLIEPDLSAKGTAIMEKISIDESGILTNVLETVGKCCCAKDIREAKVVISGGRGFKKKEDFEKLHELADLMGGVVGATRPLVQDEWIEKDYQIGQSGKVISPDLYLCFGVSGAVMHTCGVVNPKKVIAVNNDPKAPIFSIADYGIVADCKSVLNELIKELKGRA